jgi:hypothetical protein
MQSEVIRIKEREDDYSVRVYGPSFFSGFCIFVLLLLFIVLLVMVGRTNELLKHMLLLKFGRSSRL